MTTLQSLGVGFVCGAIGPLVNGPAVSWLALSILSHLLLIWQDVIKTRLMQQSASTIDPYRGPIDCAKRIVQNEGIAGLYRGLLPRLSRIAPGQAITWTVVEQVNRWLTV